MMSRSGRHHIGRQQGHVDVAFVTDHKLKIFMVASWHEAMIDLKRAGVV